MSLSDQLSTLAARAKEAEDHVSAAQKKAKDAIQPDIDSARQSAAARGDALRKKAADTKGKASSGWDNMQRSWNQHLAALQKNFEDKKAEHDLKSAERKADGAYEDAEWAIDYASAAIDEAEYAVLEATAARKQADQLAAKA